jgi:putative hydrolase of the HAD superfamily
MLYWIFDLDYTLYDIPIEIKFDYTLLKSDSQLDHLLKNLPFKKLIFTNGTFNHGLICLDKMNISNNFDKLIARDTINDLKPKFSSYRQFIKMTNIKSRDKCIFFEDNVDNLIQAKNFGWITVLITKENVINESIDFQFPNIYVALNYFLSKINKNN